MTYSLYWIDLFGVFVFALSGGLVASRKQLDIVGFGMLATVTGIGGGTLRDLLLVRQVGWITSPEYLGICLAAAVLTFFLAPGLQRRYVVLVWLDAAGIALFCVMGAGIALDAGVHPFVAVVMGVMTATFGGMMRDVIGNELPLVLRKELYVTCAAGGAAVYVVCTLFGLPEVLAQSSGFLIAFGLRAVGYLNHISLPQYKARPGREYPDPDH